MSTTQIVEITNLTISRNYGWSAAGSFGQTGRMNGNSRLTTFGGSGQAVPSVPFISIRGGSGGRSRTLEVERSVQGHYSVMGKVAKMVKIFVLFIVELNVSYYFFLLFSYRI